jgi:hypothetical protein
MLPSEEPNDSKKKCIQLEDHNIEICFNEEKKLIRQSSVNEQKNNEWVSCCMKMDKQAVKYFLQVSILGGLIVFSSAMLVVEPDCNSQRNYSSLLMICLGTLIPQPKMS